VTDTRQALKDIGAALSVSRMWNRTLTGCTLIWLRLFEEMDPVRALERVGLGGEEDFKARSRRSLRRSLRRSIPPVKAAAAVAKDLAPRGQLLCEDDTADNDWRRRFIEQYCLCRTSLCSLWCAPRPHRGFRRRQRRIALRVSSYVKTSNAPVSVWKVRLCPSCISGCVVNKTDASRLFLLSAKVRNVTALMAALLHL